MTRDFKGYANHLPHPHWPDNARVAVSFVLNIEEGAELNLSMGDERNESVHEIVAEVTGTSDLCMESHFEYGSRAGYWRIIELLQQSGVTCTVNACVRALETTPWISEDIKQRGFEIMCHGYRWESQAHLSREDEQAMIRLCTDRIEQLSGQRPLGWHTKSHPSVNTRELLVAEGYFYDSNAYNDDLPYTLDVNGHSHIVLPYSFDTNDMRFQNNGGFRFGDDFARYCIDAFDWLWEEGATQPKMMTIGLHTRIIGRPGRIAGLQKLLAHMQQKGKDAVWWAQRIEIARHWRDQVINQRV